MTIVPVTSADLAAAEVSWFSALCSDDYAYLGVPDGALRSSWEHCRDILLEAEKQGFRNILCPSSYQVGQDTLSFVAGCAPLTDRINMLAAVRCGEMQPIMLARTLATLDHMLKGRLVINIINGQICLTIFHNVGREETLWNSKIKANRFRRMDTNGCRESTAPPSCTGKGKFCAASPGGSVTVAPNITFPFVHSRC